MSWTDVDAPHKIVLARSTDSNESWSLPLLLASGDVQGSIPGVAPDGTVYVVFGRSIFHGAPGTIEIVKSNDGGVSFSSPAVIANIASIPWYLPNSWFRSPASLPAFAVSPANGNLYVAWADYRNGDADIYLTRSVALGGVLTFTLVLENAGLGDAPAVYLTDTLPISTTYVPDSLIYPPGSGTGGYDPATETITWTGAVSVGLPVTLTLQVTTSPHLTDGASVTNTAIIADGYESYIRTARAIVRQPPFVVKTYPADGERNVPVVAPLVITFNEPIITPTLFYAVTPDPGGWTEIWNADDSAVTLHHTDWSYSQIYTVTIGKGNGSGTVLMPGSVPNPWVFTTAPELDNLLYLPLILRE